jgi:hypothetical protein
MLLEDKFKGLHLTKKQFKKLKTLCIEKEAANVEKQKGTYTVEDALTLFHGTHVSLETLEQVLQEGKFLKSPFQDTIQKIKHNLDGFRKEVKHYIRRNQEEIAETLSKACKVALVGGMITGAVFGIRALVREMNYVDLTTDALALYADFNRDGSPSVQEQTLFFKDFYADKKVDSTDPYKPRLAAGKKASYEALKQMYAQYQPSESYTLAAEKLKLINIDNKRIIAESDNFDTVYNAALREYAYRDNDGYITGAEIKAFETDLFRDKNVIYFYPAWPKLQDGSKASRDEVMRWIKSYTPSQEFLKNSAKKQ